MTDLFKRAVDHASTLPPDMQDAIARMVMAYAGGGAEVYHLTAEEHAAQDEADAAIARGELATASEVEAVFSRYRA